MEKIKKPKLKKIEVVMCENCKNEKSWFDFPLGGRLIPLCARCYFGLAYSLKIDLEILEDEGWTNFNQRIEKTSWRIKNDQ